VRGVEIMDVALLGIMGSFVLLSLLTFLVVDATRLCRRYIKFVSCAQVRCYAPAETAKGGSATIEGRNAGPDQQSKGPNSENLSEIMEYKTQWCRIGLIAKRTRNVIGMILYPFLVMFLIVLARLSYFDNWNLPLGLALVYLVIAAYAAHCAIALRRAAEQARERAINKLNYALLEGDEKVQSKMLLPEENKLIAEEIKLTIEHIKSIREGAFQPWSQQPVIKALLFPLGGGLGLALTEYLLWAS
jgi:hypothetical protein